MRSGAVNPGEPITMPVCVIVLAAHSQGTVISAATIHQLDTFDKLPHDESAIDVLPRVGFLSFWFALGEIPPEHVGAALGLYLISWGIFTAYMFFASLRTTAAVALVFLLLAITFFLLGIGESSESSGMVEIGGWTGLLTAAAAWYASFAAVINSTFGRTVLPVMPLGDK